MDAARSSNLVGVAAEIGYLKAVWDLAERVNLPEMRRTIEQQVEDLMRRFATLAPDTTF